MCRLAWRLDQRLVSPGEKRSSTICRRPCMADRTGRKQFQSVGRTCRNWRPDIFALASANGFQQISVHHNWTSQRLLRRRNQTNQLERLHHRASKISMGTQQAARQNLLGIGPSCLDPSLIKTRSKPHNRRRLLHREETETIFEAQFLLK